MVHILSIAQVASLVLAAYASPLSPRQKDRGIGFNSNTVSSPEISALKSALVSAPGFEDRQAILVPNAADASNLTFTFINNTVTHGTGGTIALATLENFPALIDTKVGLAVGFVNPCGLNVPHNHPRANEFLTVIQGELVAGLVLEEEYGGNGDIVGQPPTIPGPLPIVNATLSNYKSFLFPQGQTHFQFNPTCEPALFAAAFDNSDPGRNQIARNFFSVMPDDVLISATGGNLEVLDGKRIGKLRGLIPDAFAVVMEDCAARCNLHH